MSIKNSILFTGIVALMVCAGYYAYTQFIREPEKPWFTTERPIRRSISQVIRATGYLEAEDTLKIGSLVAGVIRKMFFEENQPVKKGDLLAIIDDGRGDTDVRETAGNLEQAKHDYTYRKAHYERQKKLFEAGHLAKDAFEQETRDLENTQAAIATKQALADRAELIFKNKKISAPENGVVISKVSTEGETVTTIASPATILYTIAKDLKDMKVNLEIDENRIGEIRVGHTAILTFDTYPYRKFSGIIKDVSNSPIKKQTAVSYKATFIIDNTEKLLRPGMTVNARITVAEKPDALSIPGNFFAMHGSLIEELCKLKKMACKPLEKQKKKNLELKGAYKTVWVYRDNGFVEVPVELGINDNAFFEIVSGLTEKDLVVSDIVEPDAMKSVYGKVFGKGL